MDNYIIDFVEVVIKKLTYLGEMIRIIVSIVVRVRV